MYIDLPLVGQGLTRVWDCGHVVCRTKLCKYRESRAFFLLPFYDGVPPFEMSLDNILPFGGTRIVYLRAFRVTDARMNMVRPANRH